VALAAVGKAAASFSRSASREALRATAWVTQVAVQAATAFAERRRSSGRRGAQGDASGVGAEAPSSVGATGTAKGSDRRSPTGEAGSGI
jgi:hypothetical protein